MNSLSEAPFQYNPAVTNVNIDNQLAAILDQFEYDYIMDVISDALDNRFRLYDLPTPNIVAAYEMQFKALTDGFSSYSGEITETRNRVYYNIISKICNYYDIEFNDTSEIDIYSAAYWMYDFFVSNFTKHLIEFYTQFLIAERDSLDSAFGITGLRRENDVVYSYSKRLFKDPKIAAIHANLEYVITNMSDINISLYNILVYAYSNNVSISSYIYGLVKDDTGTFFKTQYGSYVTNSKMSADIITQIKMNLQTMGAEVLPNN